MKEMMKLDFTLALYAVISCTVLAVVNNFTAPKIAQNQVEKVNQAMEAFFPGAPGEYAFESVSDFEPATVGTIKIENMIIAKKGGVAVGGAAQVNGPTYDQATILVGMKSDGTITGLQFLKNTDSPGFGLKANDPTFTLSNGKTFYGQFEGKNAKDGFTRGQTFDAISGATITSDGVANLLREGTGSLLKYLEKLPQGGSNE